MISESFKLPAHTISESLHAGSFCFPVVYFEVVLIDELVPPKPHFAGRPSSPCNWRSTMLKSREKGRLDSVQGEGPPRLSPGRRAASTQSREKGRLVSVQGEGPPRLSPGRRAASTQSREKGRLDSVQGEGPPRLQCARPPALTNHISSGTGPVVSAWFLQFRPSSADFGKKMRQGRFT
jgi:hypothetical protein